MRTAFVVLLALTFPGSRLSAQGRAADDAAIRALAAAVEEATNKRDAAAIAGLMAPDGDRAFMDGPRSTGRAAIQQSLEESFSTWPSTTRLTIAVTDIRFLGQDVAIVDAEGRYNEGAVQTNRAIWVMVRRDGTWLFAAVRGYPAQRPE